LQNVALNVRLLIALGVCVYVLDTLETRTNQEEQEHEQEQE